MGDKATAGKIIARAAAALLAVGAVCALIAGRRYGLFSGLRPGEPEIPEGFIDENATHAFVHYFDAGHGNAVLAGSEGHYMLIDTGPADDSDSVITQLRGEGIAELDYLVLTGAGGEHTGEAADIISRFRVNKVIASQDGGLYEIVISAGMPQADILSGEQHFELGACVFDTYTADSEGAGEHSLFLKLSHGRNSFLFTGDSSACGEEELIKKHTDLSADVLYAGAHAARDSCCPALLSAVMPRFTVVPCGRDNGQGLPNRDTLRRIRKFSETVCITYETGWVRFESDGSRLKMTAEKDTGTEDTSSAPGLNESAGS